MGKREVFILVLGAIAVGHWYAGTTHKFQLGIEVFDPALYEQLRTLRLAVLTNQTGIDQHGQRTVDVLRTRGCTVTYLLAPEHGLDGTGHAGSTVSDTRDAKTHIPIISLYGGGGKPFVAPHETVLAAIDAFVVDLQDCGMRHYTYSSMLYKIMELAQMHDKRVIVLDRPNPLGLKTEGSIVEPSLVSFVSIAPLPLRHGLTIGELARYFNRDVLKKPARLTVIPMRGYQRKQSGTGTPGRSLCAPLSPNIKNIDSCYGYSFLCILGAIAPFFVGVTPEGSDQAFRVLALPAEYYMPEVWHAVAQVLAVHGITSESVALRKEHTGLHVDQGAAHATHTDYVGVSLRVNHIHNLSCVLVILDLLDILVPACKRQGVSLTFAPIFDKLVGTQALRAYINGTLTREEFLHKATSESTAFREQVRDLLLY